MNSRQLQNCLSRLISGSPTAERRKLNPKICKPERGSKSSGDGSLGTAGRPSRRASSSCHKKSRPGLAPEPITGKFCTMHTIGFGSHRSFYGKKIQKIITSSITPFSCYCETLQSVYAFDKHEFSSNDLQYYLIPFGKPHTKINTKVQSNLQMLKQPLKEKINQQCQPSIKERMDRQTASDRLWASSNSCTGCLMKVNGSCFKLD